MRYLKEPAEKEEPDIFIWPLFLSPPLRILKIQVENSGGKEMAKRKMAPRNEK